MLRKKAGRILVGLIFAVLIPFGSLPSAQEQNVSEEEGQVETIEELTGKTLDTVTGRDLKMTDFYEKYAFQFAKNITHHTMNYHLNSRGYARHQKSMMVSVHYGNWQDILNKKVKVGEILGKILHTQYDPSILKGQQTLTWLYVQPDDPDPKKSINNAAWIYFPELRRVRRLAVGDTSDAVGGGIRTFDDVNVRNINWETHEIVAEDTIRPEDYGLTAYGKKYPRKTFYMNEPRRCWVVESRAVIPNYYLSRRLAWYDQKIFKRIREEQYDKKGELLNIGDCNYDWLKGEKGTRLKLFANNYYDYQINLLQFFELRNTKADRPEVKEAWLEPDFLKKEYFWAKPITDAWLDMPRSEWPAIPKILRDRLPELNRKIVLPEEVEKKIEEEIERER